MGKESLLEAVRKCAVTKEIDETNIKQRIKSKLDKFYFDSSDMPDRYYDSVYNSRFTTNPDMHNVYELVTKNVESLSDDVLVNSEKYIDFYVSLPKDELRNYNICADNVHGVYLTPSFHNHDGNIRVPESLGTCYKFLSQNFTGLEWTRVNDVAKINFSLQDSVLHDMDCRYMFDSTVNPMLCADLSEVKVNENTDVTNMFNKCEIQELILNDSFALAKGVENMFGEYVFIEKVRNCPDYIIDIVKKYNRCEFCTYN